MRSALILTIGLFAAVPAAAPAAIITGASQAELRIEGLPLEANDITIERVNSLAIRVKDGSGVLLSAIPTCVPAGVGEVLCTLRPDRVRMLLGDGDDIVRYNRELAVVVDAGPGDDDITAGNTQNNQVDPGPGNDTIRGFFELLTYATATAPIDAEFGLDPAKPGTGTVRTDGEVDTILGSRYIQGSPFDDRIVGFSRAFGGEGDDILEGNRFQNNLYGDGGDDRLTGGDRFDYLDGGLGADVLDGGGEGIADYRSRTDSVSISDDGLANDGATGEGDLVIGVVEAYGGSGKDIIRSGATLSALHGGPNTDTLIGGPGHQSLYGDANSDKLFGGAGDDYLDGGLQVDDVDCGDGDDVYMNDAADRLAPGTCERVYVFPDH